MISNFVRRAASVRFLLPLILTSAALIQAPTTLKAQTLTSGDIAGTVEDSSGAVIPGAQVKAINAGTGSVNVVITGAAGDYRISLLQPGAYKVTVTASGFQTTQASLTLSVGEIASRNFKLAIAQNSQTVEVVGSEAPLLQTDTSDMSTTISQEQMQNLPNPGGDITYPINVTQGVIMNTQGGYGNAEAFGLPATSNNFTVNGAEDNDPFLNLNNSGPSNLLLGANDVDEINVVANAYGAQYGSLGGIQENILTRSGTNKFHGNVTYYWTNSDLNANQWFNDYNGTPESYSNANQGGAAIGGPIVKDKAFFFVNYETLRFLTSVPTLVILPNSAYESSVISNLNGIGQAAQVPFYQQLFTTYNNAPGASAAKPYNGTTYADSFEGTARSNLAESLITARVDYHFGANDNAFAHFKYDNGTQPTWVDPINSAFNSDSKQPDWEGQLQETHIFSPNLINQFGFSTAWYSAIFVNEDPTAAAAITPYTLSFTDGSFTTLGGEMLYFPEGRNVTQDQFTDDISWTKGKHTLKFGFTFKRDDTTDDDPQEYSQFANATEYGPASAPAATAAALPLSSADYFGNGQILQASQAFPQRLSAPIAQYNLGFYAQDEWKFSPNFQFTAGIRVEHNSNPVCQVNCFARFSTGYANVAAGLNTPYNSVITSGLHQAFNGLQAVAIDPRIGFTFSPNNHPNTVLRGGFGIFTDIFPATVADYLLDNPPFSAVFAASGYSAPSVPGSVTSALVSSNQAFQTAYSTGGSYNSITAVDPNFTQPYIYNTNPNIKSPTYEEYSLQIQQQVGKNTSFQVGYVGNHGYHEPWVNNGVNMYGFGGAPASPALPAFAEVNEIESAASSNYNGLVASIKNQSKYVTLQFNYTYSHALDEISNGGFLPFGYDSAGNASPATINPFNLAQQNYGNADYDIRHSLNGDYLINVPYFGGPRLLTDNWILGGTLFWHTGFPFSVIDGDVTGSLEPNYGGTVLAQVVSPSVPHHCGINKSSPGTSCFGSTATANSPDFTDPTGFGGQERNQFNGPGYFNTDFTMMKGIKIPGLESGLFQIGVEAYNILNHPNFLNPDTNYSDGPAFGTITATASGPTSVFGSGLGGNSSARILQLKANIKF
ncbi:MAG: carboxypeptidase regulatory-like domain-containing protein [Terracidiphilus sp.]